MIPFSCPVCNTAFEYPDDMAGQKIRCTGPNCNQKLLIPRPAEGATVLGRVAPFTAPPAAAPSTPLWNYLENGQTRGPVPASELKRLVAARRLTSKDSVWTTGMGDWRPMHEALPELFRKPAALKPRQPAGTKQADDGGNRGGMFEKLGIGVFAIVAAVILVGLFLVLLPLIHTAAAHVPPVPPVVDKDKGVADAGKTAGPAAGQEMKPQEVTALCKPSVALVKNRGGSGSGFLVEGGFVVTNSHVVRDDTIAAVAVTFPSSDVKGESYKARLAYEDRTRDLAILQLQGPPALPPLRFCSTKLAEGEDVLAIGSPGVPGIVGGLSENSADKGTLGNPNFHSAEFNDAKKDLHYIQHSAKINHGNSGGPLLNMRGEVIGVNVIGITEGNQGAIDGVKLAIPADELRDILAKAASRNAAAIEHATAMHDGHIMALNLAKTTSKFLGAAKFCANKGQEAFENNKKAGEAYAAARDGIAAQQKQDKTKLIDPEVARILYLDDQWDEITDLLAGSALEDDLHGKLRQLRDIYLKVKGLYESPTGTIMDVQQQLATLSSDLSKLAEALDAEFGSVY